MNHDYPQTRLSKTLLTGVFAGIIATLINLAYDFFYRDFAEFYPSDFINVSSIIFATMLLFTIAGIIYFFLNKLTKYGNIVYIVIFLILTIFCFYGSLHVMRSSNAMENQEFRGLLLGTVAVTGLLLTFFIPYLTTHDTLYND
ncbi:hypothetical protein FC093_08820 [Ilyomonas limi]|jgi:hypothetical protein|uniref:Uncharacterized protein n=1 Tax=Ilyomonas limi TaxID=2575867 RepID=A0A4U3L6Q1_9BACT|nr:hypothetical protein [Ilyomonas limi]TKK69406.1 hypothetical protein FC093_08820 [Ilyomonas limi]